MLMLYGGIISVVIWAHCAEQAAKTRDWLSMVLALVMFALSMVVLVLDIAEFMGGGAQC